MTKLGLLFYFFTNCLSLPLTNVILLKKTKCTTEAILLVQIKRKVQIDERMYITILFFNPVNDVAQKCMYSQVLKKY